MEKVDYTELDQISHELSFLALIAGAAVTNFGSDTDQTSKEFITDILTNVQARIPESISTLDASLSVRANLRRLRKAIERMLAQVDGEWSESTLACISIAAGELEPSMRRAARSVSRQSETPRITQEDRRDLIKEFGWQLGEDFEEQTQRVHRGVQETLRRFPETRTWTAEKFGFMLGIVNFDVIKSAPAFMALTKEQTGAASPGRRERTSVQDVDAAAKELYPTLWKCSNATEWARKIGDKLGRTKRVDIRTVKKTTTWSAAETRRKRAADIRDRLVGHGISSKVLESLKSDNGDWQADIAERLGAKDRERLKNDERLLELFAEQQADDRRYFQHPGA